MFSLSCLPEIEEAFEAVLTRMKPKNVLPRLESGLPWSWANRQLSRTLQSSSKTAQT